MDDEMLCSDLLFSGHTLAMVVSSLTVAYYLPTHLEHSDIYHVCYHGLAWSVWSLVGLIIPSMSFLRTGSQRQYSVETNDIWRKRGPSQQLRLTLSPQKRKRSSCCLDLICTNH
ncbi:hypothetical protein LOAG_03180 [Loa loa]|uniref:Sphingomyelin synthase-like domain-containing protein n=1 Tax=Loa loa TaxID=7209 RepID=A0A1S0U6Z0_LOALO|nr:hypothetical protein LOAG_03180 [Loa loa]EFO25309.1 hypothetical protein LOAG_03180 [Loa loa]